MDEIKIGDIYTLKSGSPDMVVTGFIDVTDQITNKINRVICLAYYSNINDLIHTWQTNNIETLCKNNAQPNAIAIANFHSNQKIKLLCEKYCNIVQIDMKYLLTLGNNTQMRNKYRAFFIYITLSNSFTVLEVANYLGLQAQSIKIAKEKLDNIIDEDFKYDKSYKETYELIKELLP